MTRLRCGWLFVTLVIAIANMAEAQPSEPPGPFVLDLRGALARFKEDPAVAQGLGVASTNLPTRGLGIVAGAHWYPLRSRLITLGIGGEFILARDSRTGEAPETTGTTTAPGTAPTVTTRLSAFSPQLSFNFGTSEGWSYISGGIGSSRLTAEREDAPFADEGPGPRTINYGGGARWFTGPHLAFAVDLRFYAISPQPASGTRPGFPRAKIMVISVGVGVK